MRGILLKKRSFSKSKVDTYSFRLYNEGAMALLTCTGCNSQTNTTFVDYFNDRGEAGTVKKCVGRYVAGKINVVEEGCDYATATDEYALRNVRRYLAKNKG
jgi:hypothetical protein